MECTKNVSENVFQFLKEAELDEVFLFGGSVIDPLINKDAKIMDYDLCVQNNSDFYRAISNLENKGYEISEIMKTHNIYTVINHPEIGQIDFSCMNPEDNGIFNIEKIYAHFSNRRGESTNEIVDKYGAIDGLREGKIRLSCDVEKEGSYNILRRFFAVTAKYNLDISKDGINQQTINQINKSFELRKHHVPQEKVRCLSRLVASLNRSKDKNLYMKNLSEQELLKNSFPDIHALFGKLSAQPKNEIQQCNSQKDILKFMLVNTPSEDRDAMVDCLMILSHREKARQEAGVRVFVDDISREKTSSQRLQQKIITPVFNHIFMKGNKR